MRFCNKHEVAYQNVECPVCSLHRELVQQKNIVQKLVTFKNTLSDDRILNFGQISKVLGKSKAILYNWRSSRAKNIPYKKQGGELCIKLGELKHWADIHNIALNLNAIGTY